MRTKKECNPTKPIIKLEKIIFQDFLEILNAILYKFI